MRSLRGTMMENGRKFYIQQRTDREQAHTMSRRMSKQELSGLMISQ